MKKDPKILIGTLFSGENEFDTCVRSLQDQCYTNWEHVVFKNLPNKEAHEKLYQEFMARQDRFDLFLKLDADMVLMNENALDQIVELFKKNRNLDHAELAVKDWFSDTLMMGVHITTKRAVWKKIKDNLFVDHNPDIPGQHVQFWDGCVPLVVHSPDPAPFQAYHFGVHRALKAFQYEVEGFVPAQARAQWGLLKKVWFQFVKRGDRRLGFAVLGAEHVVRGMARHCHYDYSNTELIEKFEDYIGLQSKDIYALLKGNWSAGRRTLRRFLAMAPQYSLFYLQRGRAILMGD